MSSTILAGVGAAVGAVVVMGLLGYNEYKRGISEGDTEGQIRESQESRLAEEENDQTPSLTYADANNVNLHRADADVFYKPIADATTVGNIPEPTLIATRVRGGRSKRKSKRRKTSKKRKHRTHRKK